MTKDEALRLALEALIEVRDANIHGLTLTQDYHEAITAIKAALEAKDEPVGTAGELFTNTALERLDFRPSTKIYVAPPQRTWVGLTKKEFEEAVYRLEDLEDCWVAIETKLKGKNT